MNVLVIHDRTETAGELRALTAEGYKVATVRTIWEDGEQAGAAPVGAILLDGSAPGTDGLRAVTGGLVLVITGHADLPAACAALGARTADASLRPVRPAEVNEKVARVFGLVAAERRLEQTARLAGVGELAASVAHELNNALGTVTLRLEGLLGKTDAGDPRRHTLDVIDQEVTRMGDLIGTLLEFVRAGRGQASTVDLCDEVRRVVELTHYHLRRRSVHTTTEIAPDVPLVQADRHQLRQVLLNLFTNAADAMPDGGHLVVRVRPEALGAGRAGVVIEIADTGTGIPPDVLPQVTEAFFTTKEEGKGTGLGLSICKRIVEQHGGALTIESVVGQGTTVRIALPVCGATTSADPCHTGAESARLTPGVSCGLR